MPFVQIITLIKVDGVDVTPVKTVSIVGDESDIDSSDDDYSYKDLDLKIPAKRGRRRLTPEEKDISNILKREYFKLYYKRNPEKYAYTKYDYNNSCIYKLTNSKTSKVYYGSTILPLHLRLARHVTAMKYPKNSTYMEMAEISTKLTDWKIEPVIKIALDSKKQLDTLEAIYISHYQDSVFNRNKKYPASIIKELCNHFQNSYLPKELQDPNKNKIYKI